MAPTPMRAAALAAILVLSGCKGDEVAAVIRPPVVRTVTPVPSRGNGSRFTGVVHARYESALGFRVAGKIAERMVDPGVHVRAGQPLMRLDSTDFDLAVKAAHAAVETARATATQAAADESRRRTLVGQGWATQQAYEQSKASADADAAQLASALAQEKQTVDQAGYAVLRTDADGVVMEVPADPGQVIAAGQTVVRLARDGAREAVVDLPEGGPADATHEAAASLYTDPSTTFPATLRELSAMADPLTRTYRARYVLDGAGQAAPLGATVTLRLAATSGAPTFDVPTGALFDDGHGPAVWAVDAAASTVSSRPVHVIRIGDEDVTVEGDLTTLDRIVALGAHLLRAGQQIDPADPSITVGVR